MSRWIVFILMPVVLLVGCGSQQAASTSGVTEVPASAATMPPMATAGTMADMHATSMPTMAMDSAAPYDAMFIDSMTMHHQGAITMAQQALTSAEHPELKQLAQAIISAQQQEITQMQAWRAAWYPKLAITKGMDMQMGAMTIATDSSKPFDQRFIEAMIPHHQSATTMAKDALQKAEHPEIKTLAQQIITSQDGEIAQMQQWQQTWFK